MSEVLSGCAVRAAIQQERQKLSVEDTHYLGAIKIRLETLYDLTEAPNVREQLSDEIDWVEEKLKSSPLPVSPPPAGEERRQGHSKLVYDKAKRTIVTVDPHPEPAPAGEWQKIVMALCKIERENNRAKREFTNVSNKLISDALAEAFAAIGLVTPPPLPTPPASNQTAE